MELSATFTSERWQQTVCSLDTPAATRRSAALFGLSKSQTEIDFLRQLFERTSKLGTLTLQLPNQAAASGEIWVSLRPELDVAERLANEASRLWHGDPRKKSPEQNTKPPGSCWHPLYSDNQNLMMLARHLTLTGNQSDVECFQQPESSQNTAAPSRYVTDSITSETEFITPNRRSKTLRLPVGTYHYELRGMPNDPSEWDDAAQAETRTAGRIVWDDKKTRPVISVW